MLGVEVFKQWLKADDIPTTQVALRICCPTARPAISSGKWLLSVVRLNKSNIEPRDAFFTRPNKCCLCSTHGSKGLQLAQQADVADGTFIGKWRKESKQTDSKRRSLPQTSHHFSTSSRWWPKIATMIVTTMWYLKSVQLRPYQGYKLCWSNTLPTLVRCLRSYESIVARVLFTSKHHCASLW